MAKNGSRAAERPRTGESPALGTTRRGSRSGGVPCLHPAEKSRPAGPVYLTIPISQSGDTLRCRVQPNVRAVNLEPSRWAGRRVLVTGHTGFKGAWLSLWLLRLGAQVSGLAPGSPTTPSMYEAT